MQLKIMEIYLVVYRLSSYEHSLICLKNEVWTAWGASLRVEATESWCAASGLGILPNLEQLDCYDATRVKITSMVIERFRGDIGHTHSTDWNDQQDLGIRSAWKFWQFCNIFFDFGVIWFPKYLAPSVTCHIYAGPSHGATSCVDITFDLKCTINWDKMTKK